MGGGKSSTGSCNSDIAMPTTVGDPSPGSLIIRLAFRQDRGWIDWQADLKENDNGCFMVIGSSADRHVIVGRNQNCQNDQPKCASVA